MPGIGLVRLSRRCPLWVQSGKVIYAKASVAHGLIGSILSGSIWPGPSHGGFRASIRRDRERRITKDDSNKKLD